VVRTSVVSIYRDRLHEKSEAFWEETNDAERSTARQPWRSADMLMGRGQTRTSTNISADELHR